MTGTTRGRIDVHHHFLSDAYVAAWGADRIGGISAAGRVPRWAAELSLELMSYAGIETAMMSVSSPGWPPDDAAARQAICRGCNLVSAELMRDHPGRFGMFAGLPLPDIDATLVEIGYAYDVLGADGVAMFTNSQGIYLGDPALDPVMAELDRRAGVVFVHPITPPGGKTLQSVSESMLDYPFETTRAIVNLLAHGTAAKFPALRFIFSHAGGTLPYLAGRVAAFSALNPQFRQGGADASAAALAGFFYDITQSATPGTFAALRALVPDTQLLFGSDVPFARRQQIALTLAGLPALGLPEASLAMIDRGNAVGLFPRLGAVRDK